MKKIAVFFPGIGYSFDRPLLYYSRKIAAEAGYEIKLIPYTGFQENIRGDQIGMVRAYSLALKQAKEMLSDIRFSDYDEILFIGKSIGTIVAATIAVGSPEKERIRMILYTPLEQTFSFGFQDAVAFTGLADPWVGGENSRIPKLCEEKKIPCFLYENANHSLETGHWKDDLDNLTRIMDETASFVLRQHTCHFQKEW